jgi:hypothetical protein
MSRKRLTKAERNVESSPDRSLSDPNVTPLKDRVTNRTFRVLRSIELLAFLSGVLLSIKSTIETS